MKYFKINIHPFTGVIHIWHGNFEDIVENVQKKVKNIKTEDLFEVGDIASTITMFNPDEGTTLCVFLGPEVEDKHIFHECLHAAWYALDNYGVTVNIDNHEALAYMQTYLFEQITKKLKR